MRAAITIGLVILLTPALRADEKEAKEILERAIKAHGGTSNMTASARHQRTDTGTLVVQGRAVPFVSQVTRDLPERMKLEMEIAKVQKTTLVLDGETVYQNDGGTTRTLEQQRVKEVREEAYIDWLMTLVPLTKSEYTLKSLGKSKMDKDAVVGIKASRKGQPDVSLYFLEKSGLLVKLEWRGRMAGLEVDKERHLTEHKSFEGVKVHTKETALVNGKKFNEFTISKVTFPSKLDAKTFAKP